MTSTLVAFDKPEDAMQVDSEEEDNYPNEISENENETAIIAPAKKEDFPPIYTELFFSSSLRILRKRRKLQHSDLWELRPSHFTGLLHEHFEKVWNDAMKVGNPSLPIVLIKVFRKQLSISITLFLLYAMFSFLPSVILPRMIQYLEDMSIPYWHGILYTVAVTLSTLLGSLCYYHSLWQAVMTGMKMRTVMMTAVYRKAVILPKSSGDSAGRIVNLYAADSQLIFDSMDKIIPGIVGPVQIIGAVIYLGFYVQWYALIVVAVFVISFPLALHLGDKVQLYRRRIQMFADVRLKLTSEFIQGIRIVKYYAWEQPFFQNIVNARTQEMGEIRKLSYTRALIIFLVSNTSTSCLAFLLLFYGVFGPGLTVSVAFTVIAIMNVTRQPFSWASVAYLIFSYNKSSMDRVGFFLASPEKEAYIQSDLKLPEGTISVENANFFWAKDGEPVLKSINLKVSPGEKVMIVGKVGSGKTTLAMALLGEMPFVTGNVSVNGTVAYVPQQAWIYNATVRDNILFGNPYSERRYALAVEAAALKTDFTQFKAGDLTEIGERGVNLSGGQKQRIAIARALYSSRDIYILDDPLSAVDSHVSKHLFKNAIQGYLGNKTIIMITNQLQYLPFADRVVFLSEGSIAGQGTFDQLKNSNKDFSKLMRKYGVLEEEEKEEEKLVVEKVKKEVKQEVPHQETKTKEEVQKEEADRTTKGALIQIEDKQSGLIPLKIYWHYIKKGGLRWWWLGVFLFATYATVKVLDTWWLDVWTQSIQSSTFGNVTNSGNQKDPIYWPLTYMGWLFGESISLACALLVVLGTFSVNTSWNLHNELLKKLTYGVTAFYDRTPIGRILSRLSQDMTTIDFLLSVNFPNFMNYFFLLLSTFAGFGLGVWWILLALLPLIGFYFALQIYFRKTNIEIQRLESLSRAPPISHLSSTITGIDTIRAFGKINQFKRLCDIHLDNNDVEKHALKFVNMWYGIRLDWIGAIIVFFVFGGITLGRNFTNLNPGSGGIAMSYTSGFTSLLSSFSVFSSDLEIKMNSVERFWEYERIAQENLEAADGYKPPEGWPLNGEIVFKDFSFKYRQGPMVLNNLNLHINAKAKVGIVGRTGAGKSSLMQALYRIEEPENGTIIIDDVDFTKLGLKNLRSRLAIIPQDPAIFMETLRYNMDPFREYTDEEIWTALDTVQLREVIVDHPDKLEQKCEENGQNFSLGQRQLLCMARAVLKKTPVLLLDEATASVDIETDALIQSTIRRVFKDCTVLTIAHRLNTIMDSDMILVLDKGHVAEYDTPVNLLSRKDGVFYSMVQATGPSSANYLKSIAEGTASVMTGFSSETSKSKGKGKPKKPKTQNVKLE